MATYAVGIGVPFWLIAGASMSLPKSGRWMDGVKSVFGVGLLVVALYYLKNVVPSLWKFTGHTPAFALVCAAAIVVGLALGAIHLSFGDGAVRAARKGVGVALLVVAGFGLVNWTLTPTTELAWHAKESDALAAAKKSDKPVLVDFGAKWCTPCLEMEAHVFPAPSVSSVLTDRFTLLKVSCDHEDEDPEVQRLRARYDARTLPAIRIVSPDGQVLARLDQAVSPDEFLAFLLKSRTVAAE
jgi:thiol:disulfide interchange protein DsbD